jgi:thiosulfate dehydrogenase [quinone] large subunit
VVVDSKFSRAQLWALFSLRVIIGWHFLYEGVVKMLNPYWSAAGYLKESRWIFSDLFHWMADNPTVLEAVDAANTWGLTLIGFGLVAGLLARFASLAGACLLLLYYICNPPLVGLHYAIPMEGNYLIVNKELVESAALIVIYLFPTSHVLGLDLFLSRLKRWGFRRVLSS